MASYSFLYLMAGLAFVAGLILLTRHPEWNDYLAFGIIVGGLAAGRSIDSKHLRISLD